MHANTKLPPDELTVNKFKDLYPDLSQDELSKIFNICKPTINKWAKLYKLKVNKNSTKRHSKRSMLKDHLIREEFIKLYSDGVDSQTLASKYNVDLTTISNWAKKLEIRRVPLPRYSSINKGSFDPSKIYYVYCLLDPSNNDQPFYVGKGCKNRVSIHYTASGLEKKPTDRFFNYQKASVIRNYRSLGYKDKYYFIKTGMSELEALDLEKETISKIGRISVGGTLTNQTDGGDTAPVNKGKNHYAYEFKPWQYANANKSYWTHCDLLYKLWVDSGKLKHDRFVNFIQDKFNVAYSSTLINVLKKFRSGWVPNEDSEWLKFKEKYKNDK